jgi:CelD/BcsL family acetyltransferase involved in cellulose biosynthesis
MITAPAPQAGREVRAEMISDPATFAALREEWTELLQDSASDGFFLTWEWLHSWWKHLAEKRSLFLITVRAGTKLVAVAPFALRPGAPWLNPPVRCLEMLGSGIAGSDYLDVIVRRGWEAECSQALSILLAEHGEMLALSRLRAGTSFARQLVTTLAQRGFRADEVMKFEVCPYLPRPPGGFAEYMQGLGSEHRYAFRRKVQALNKRFAVQFAAASSEETRRSSLATLIELHQKRWRLRDGASEAFTSPALIAFHEEVSALALAKGWLRLFVLSADGQPVSALYGFRYGEIFSFYQSGFDPGWAKQSVGMVTMGLAIESAFGEGCAEFDMLHGDEAYKFHWARQVHELSRIELFPPGPRGLITQGVCVLAKTARRAGKKLLVRIEGKQANPVKEPAAHPEPNPQAKPPAKEGAVRAAVS